MNSENPTTVYLVRHAESENNISNIIGENPHLTTNGQKQAEMVNAKLSNIIFDVIFSSDLIRAQETAGFFAQRNDQNVVTHAGLRERNYGKYEGVSMEKFQEDMKEVHKQMEKMTDEEKKTFRRYDSFETDEELMARFTSFLDDVSKRYSGKTVLLVTHGILMRTLLIYLNHATYAQLPPFGIDNTAYIKLERVGKLYTVKETNGVHVKDNLLIK